MKRTVLALSLIAILVLTVTSPARADSRPQLGDAVDDLMGTLANLGVAFSIVVMEELSKAGEQVVREHLEFESWRGPAIEPDEYVGGFNLKLYPQGKSHSAEHFKAETWYRFDRHGLKEFELNTSRPENK